MAKSPIKAGADDRIPPSQECSPHPGRKQKAKQTTNPQKTARNGEKSGLTQLYKNPTKSNRRTQRQQGVDPATDQNRSKKVPAHREKAKIPIFVVKQ